MLTERQSIRPQENSFPGKDLYPHGNTTSKNINISRKDGKIKQETLFCRWLSRGGIAVLSCMPRLKRTPFFPETAPVHHAPPKKTRKILRISVEKNEKHDTVYIEQYTQACRRDD
jgi:hypothetical protein